MKVFQNKSVFKKLIIVFLIITIFNYCIPKKVNATNDENGIGGKLFRPIQSLCVAVGDTFEYMLNLVVGGKTRGAVMTLAAKTVENFDPIKYQGNYQQMGGTFFPTLQKKVFEWFLSYTGGDFAVEIELPTMLITPDKIFQNKIALLDVNIISPTTYDDGKESATSVLKPIISGWYIILRNMALVAFLSILVYIGIRIIISSVAEEKSKYKQLLMDWFVGLCLLFIMHYIMSFSFIFVEKITDFISTSNSMEYYKIVNEDITINPVDEEDSYYLADKDQQEIINEYNSGETLNWSTDLAGYIRFFAQTNFKSFNVYTQFGYTIMYLVIVIYTYIFVFQYIRRLLNIVLLALLAPLVAFAYPLDKISDGKAQAFNMWIREFIYNLLLQPMHLLLYTVLVGSAISLATEHPIYAIVVMGFLLQGEKIIRKMFKFDNNTSMIKPAGGGLVTGAIVMQGMNRLMGGVKSKGGHKGASGNKAEGHTGDASSKIKFNDISATRNQNDILQGALSGGKEDIKDKEVNVSKANIADVKGQDGVQNDNSKRIAQNDKAVNEAIKQKQDKNKNVKIKNKSYLGTAAKLYGGKLAKGTAKKMAKGLGMGLVGGTAGVIGISAGLASEDYSNMVKWGSAGIAGGATAGKMVVNNGIKTAEAIPNIANNFKNADIEIQKEMRRNNPEEYEAYQNKIANEIFMKDKEIQKQYQNKFGKDYSKYMNAALKYREAGISDNEKIIKAMSQKSEFLGDDIASDRRILVAKLAENAKSEKDMESLETRFKKRGYSEEDIENVTNEIRKYNKMV